MDTGLLNNFGGEHFSTFDSFDQMGLEDSLGVDGVNPFEEWENERELNGDIALIPVSSTFCQSLKDITESPPSEIFQKMIEDWPIEVMGSGNLSHPVDEDAIHSWNNFDISSFIPDTLPPPPPPTPKFKAPVKKIDVNAQKYIVEKDILIKVESDMCDDLIDVETVQEGDNQPVLEAFDPFSLLEQFEASEKPNLMVSAVKLESLNEIGKVPETPVEIFASAKLPPTVTVEKKPEQVHHRKETDVMTTNATAAPKAFKNKQIIEALPQELIARINESGKRKTITVIPPIPNNKIKKSRARTSDVTATMNKTKTVKTTTTTFTKSKTENKTVSTEVAAVSNKVQLLDHDYCTSGLTYPEVPKKDSGFESGDEEERNVIRNQPTVKTADGKLMVSLLKVNTIRNVSNKKKLNLEEYKKRRLINSATTSQSSSPISSTCSSPLPEDENLKRLRHQEKMMKMSADLLNTPPKKDAVKTETVPVKIPSVERKEREVLPPPDMEMKTFVSIATNTENTNGDDLLASVEHLEEIKPLLLKASGRINANSFINELIENIPKVKCKKSSTTTNNRDNGSTEIVRENKMVYFLKKDRPQVKTESIGVQTRISLIAEDMQCRYRRRTTSTSSQSTSSSSDSYCSSYRRGRRGHRSPTSSTSSRSSRSTRASSRSRSRSSSPKRARYLSAERLREVEERRVIYVGRIDSNCTKDDLRRRFRQFGVIINVSLHFREYGDNYGFVTFANKEDAYEAVEHGNDGFVSPKFDLSFGGRRIFCKTTYSDLDNMRDDDYNYYNKREADDSFESLLREHKEKRRRKP